MCSLNPSGCYPCREDLPPGDIGECAVSVISVENILTIVSDENIVETVVIVVTDGDTAGPTGANKSGLLCDIGKGTITIIFVQSIGGAGGGSSIRVPQSMSMSSQPSLS